MCQIIDVFVDIKYKCYVFRCIWLSTKVAVVTHSQCLRQWTLILCALCGLQSCKNRPAPFPGRMSYKATKPGLACLSYLSMLYYCIVVYYGPFYELLVFVAVYSVF